MTDEQNPSNEAIGGIEMPRYKCHKIVHALRIQEIFDVEGAIGLHFEDKQYAPIKIEYPEAARIKQAWSSHIESDDLGYLVVYEGGYRSWSPTKEFEDGYTLL